MDLKKGQSIELDVTNVVFGGRGIARADGFVVFIENALPGDRVRAVIVKKKKNHAVGRIETIVRPSPFRINAPCRYSGFCGGCKWQCLAYEKQLEAKQQHVKDALAHIGQLTDIPVHPTLPSERIYAYRNKMEFSCSDKRWVLPDELDCLPCQKEFAVGLHVPGIFHKVIDIDECWIQPPLGNAILNDIKDYIKNSGLPVYGLRSHEGFWRFAVLRHASVNNQWMVNLVTAEENLTVLRPLAERLRVKFPRIVSVVNNVTARKAAIAVGEREVLISGQATLKECIGKYVYEISSNSFFQTNTAGAKQLYDIVKRYAGLSGNEVVVDLYGGTGTIAIYLAESAKEIIGMEINEDAIADAHRNCRLNGIVNCRFIPGDIKDSLAGLACKPDVMVIDPPRAGMHPHVVKQILSKAPEKIVYVSCNPTTLARDLIFLKDTYSVREIQPVDMFPHTYHIESVARLVKR